MKLSPPPPVRRSLADRSPPASNHRFDRMIVRYSDGVWIKLHCLLVLSFTVDFLHWTNYRENVFTYVT